MKTICIVVIFLLALNPKPETEVSGGFDSPQEVVEFFLTQYVVCINDKEQTKDRFQKILDTAVLPRDLYDQHILIGPGMTYARDGFEKIITEDVEPDWNMTAGDWAVKECDDPIDVAQGEVIRGRGKALKPVKIAQCVFTIDFKIDDECEVEQEGITLIKIQGKWWII